MIAVGAGVTWLLAQQWSDISGDRMARYAYTGPERRQGEGWQTLALKDEWALLSVRRRTAWSRAG